MNKTERQETVESLSALLKDAPNVYVTDFSGMNVLRMTEFRRRLRAAGVSYVVVKNTLAQRALAANGITGLDDHLAGPTGLVLGKDALTAAKVLGDFAREFERPTVKAGLVRPPASSSRLPIGPAPRFRRAMVRCGRKARSSGGTPTRMRAASTLL